MLASDTITQDVVTLSDRLDKRTAELVAELSKHVKTKVAKASLFRQQALRFVDDGLMPSLAKTMPDHAIDGLRFTGALITVIDIKHTLRLITIVKAKPSQPLNAQHVQAIARNAYYQPVYNLLSGNVRLSNEVDIHEFITTFSRFNKHYNGWLGRAKDIEQMAELFKPCG